MIKEGSEVMISESDFMTFMSLTPNL